MSKLLPIFIASLILVVLAERNSTYELGIYGEKKYIHRDKLFFLIIAIVLSVFVGLRTRYNDTGTYLKGYENTEVPDMLLANLNWDIASSPGFNIVQRILKYFSASAQSFLMLFAFITICIYIWFIRKYTNNMWMSVFLFSTMGCYTFTMAAIRQCVAVAFCLIATDRAIQKKWTSFVLWVLFACTFHPYSILYLLVPILKFKPWTGKTYWMIGFCAMIGICLESLMGTVIDITTMMGKDYTADSLLGEGVNVFRLLVVWVPVILSFLARKFLRKSKDETANLIINLSMLNAEIMFIALFGTANYFARLANYFLIFQTISLPWILSFFDEKSKKMLTLWAVVGFLLYFYYANGIQFGGFDSIYSSVPLMEYLKTGLFTGG